MNNNAKWIKSDGTIGEISPDFRKSIKLKNKVCKVEACVTSYGVYDFFVNGTKVGKGFMAPGWTSYPSRIQYQRYDITELVSEDTELSIIAGKGWALGNIGYHRRPAVDCSKIAVIASIEITYKDGRSETVVTDESWEVYTSKILFSELYDGETVDATAEVKKLCDAIIDTEEKPALVEQVGEFIAERERVFASEYIVTPNGEKVIDFGQNLAGYVELHIKAKKGDKVVISHAEVLDKEGNFYTENLRKALNTMTYICSGDEDVFAPRFSFQGFRYIRLDEFPVDVDLNNFTAVVVYSDMKRTGHFSCGYDKLNRLYSHTIWGQRGNFIDIPTDCPQRNERLGWTGDAEVFCRTAAINYDVYNFFKKWLGDMALEQLENGGIRAVIPTITDCGMRVSTAWADAATICPWEMYLAYGDVEMLREHYPMMKKWVEYMHNAGDDEFLWLGGDHYGDWLAMDAGYGIYVGATQTDFIASAFFAYSTALVIKAGKVLGEDTSYFEDLYVKVRARFRECFMKDGMPSSYNSEELGLEEAQKKQVQSVIKSVTQTAIVLILRFGLYEENERVALIDKLAQLIDENDGRMTTGFVGTPHILHALSDNGRADKAFDLLLQEKNPSWLFSVNMGATTIWEHWDSINEQGEMWSTRMNSFNHYAYGSVFDWVYGDMLGIKICDDGAAYTKIELAPLTDKRIGFAEGSIETRLGKVASSWRYIGDKVRYEFTVPENTVATIKLAGGFERTVGGGTYVIVR